MTFCPLENCKMKMSRTDVDRIYLGGNWALPAWSQDFLWERTNFSCLGEVVFLGRGHFNKRSGSFHFVPGGVSREEEETSRCGVRGDREKESQEGMGPAVQEGQ